MLYSNVINGQFFLTAKVLNVPQIRQSWSIPYIETGLIKTFVTTQRHANSNHQVTRLDDCCLHETRSCNKGFELTHFYVWFISTAMTHNVWKPNLTVTLTVQTKVNLQDLAGCRYRTELNQARVCCTAEQTEEKASSEETT